MKLLTGALCALAVLCPAAPALAETVYLSTPDLAAVPTTNGWETAPGIYEAYDKFVITDPSALFDIQIVVTDGYGASAGPTPFAAGIGWIIKSDAAGAPGAVTFAQTVGPSAAGFSAVSQGNGTMLVNIPLNFFTPLGPGTYWLGIGAFDPLQVTGFGNSGSMLTFSKENGFVATDQTMGFRLVGAVNSVPEPSTWAMLIIGFGLVGFRLRARTATTSSSAP